MIDLHVHSLCSDGTCAPAELARRGRAFRAMAVTDHDNCDGVDEFLRASEGDGVRLSGVELSVDPGEGYGVFHLLGLGVDPGNAALKALLRRILDGRSARNARIRARFAEIGISIPSGEVEAYARGEIVARPHFARWLADRGYASGVKAAFDAYLAPSSPPGTNCYVPRFRPPPRDAFDAIHAAGGVAVMAHPRYWTRDPAALREGLGRLKEEGLDGLEAVYQANSPEETVDHVRAARELGLCMTAGSDFHGENKPAVPLGMRVEDEEAFLAPLLERIASRRGA